MRVFISCLIISLTFGCKGAKRGSFGGLTDDQQTEFNAFRSNWGDAHKAFKGAIGFTDSSGGRAADMQKLLQDHCTPTRVGSYDIPLGGGGQYERSLGDAATGCAITATEKKSVLMTKPTSTYHVGVLYSVTKNDIGTLYQSKDSLRYLNVDGQFSVSKYAGSQASTAGSWTISYANASELNDSAHRGRIDVFDGVLRLAIELPSGWQLEATATWNPSSLSTETKYTVQGAEVTSGQFNDAFGDLHIPDMIKYAQNIPQQL